MSALTQLVWGWMDWKTIGILVTVVFTTRWLIWKGYLFSSGKKLPPGIYGLPIVGVMPYFFFSRKAVFEKIEEYTKIYGPIIRQGTGKNGTIYLVSGTEAVREVLLNDDILGRPPSNFDDKELAEAFDFKSIINLEGDIWKKHRRFSLITLRDLGFGKTPVMEGHLQEEIKEFVSSIEEKGGELFDVQAILVPSVSNNVSTLVFGERLPFSHPKRKELNFLLTAFSDETDKFIALASFPKLLKILYKLNIGFGKKLNDVFSRFKKMTNDEVEEHKKNLDRENPKDYLDHYILEAEKDPDFTVELAGGNAMAFFSAGSSTTRVTLEYMFHLMAAHPQVAEKVFEEIVQVAGRDREVTWTDSANMPYTMAVIAERHRIYTVAPLGVGRRVVRDTKLCGYELAAGARILYNLDSVHFDPKTFADPYEFRPERFLDNGKLVHTEKILPFSMGKRACPGESLAVMEVFLYFANVVQKFKILPGGDTVKFKRLRTFIAEVVRQKLRYVVRD